MNKRLLWLGLALGTGLILYTSSTPLEAIASLTGLLSVWLTAREHIWAWPIGLVNVACFFYMFYDVKLYADMTLQLFFFALGLYGWIVWLSGRGDAKVRPTSRIARAEAGWLVLFLIAASVVWGFLLHRYTDASIPYADALIAVLSLIAQYLLSKKVLENWYVWIVVDVLSIGLYAYKGLDAVAVLYVVYLGIATAGLFGWKAQYAIQRGGRTDG
ncbi:nicotinamide riboside transporter PnuC [Paenibacillus hodogayensis]|uniref:Nicotinamide riboside transporter PnuC n=1 Tax=Paenibacillus hodogayensis TaxID=279208 RepID=A0ABV5VZX2_9BACL